MTSLIPASSLRGAKSNRSPRFARNTNYELARDDDNFIITIKEEKHDEL